MPFQLFGKRSYCKNAILTGTWYVARYDHALTKLLLIQVSVGVLFVTSHLLETSSHRLFLPLVREVTVEVQFFTARSNLQAATTQG